MNKSTEDCSLSARINWNVCNWSDNPEGKREWYVMLLQVVTTMLNSY